MWLQWAFLIPFHTLFQLIEKLSFSGYRQKAVAANLTVGRKVLRFHKVPMHRFWGSSSIVRMISSFPCSLLQLSRCLASGNRFQMIFIFLCICKGMDNPHQITAFKQCCKLFFIDQTIPDSLSAVVKSYSPRNGECFVLAFYLQQFLAIVLWSWMATKHSSVYWLSYPFNFDQQQFSANNNSSVILQCVLSDSSSCCFIGM